jgi:hypothetical protein
MQRLGISRPSLENNLGTDEPSEQAAELPPRLQ